jgi:hypothetical protein
VHGGNDRRVVGVKSFAPQGFTFVIVQTRLDVASGRYGSPDG